MRERLVRPTATELRSVRSVPVDDLIEPSGLTLRTLTRIVAGLPVQRASLKLALQAVECVRARGTKGAA